MEPVASGYGLAEAPRPAPGGRVLFSDVLGGGVFRARDGAVATVVERRRGIGGLVPHVEGGIVVSGRDLAWADGVGGELRTLLAPEGVTGFNDLTTDARGRVLVGALRFRPFAGEQPVPGQLWRLELDGSATLLLDRGILWPNGMAVSADGRTLFVSDYARAVVARVPLDGNGVPDGPAEDFARAPEGGSCDGLALDAEGGLWVALGAHGTIGRFDSNGALVDELDVPAGFVSSVAFDEQDLLVTTAADDREQGAVLRHAAGVAGLEVTAARVALGAGGR